MRRAGLALILSAGAVATFFAYRTATLDLAPPIARAIAHGLGLPEDAVAVGAAHLQLPATLRLGDIRVGTLRIGAATIAIDPLAALRGEGRLRHGRITLGDVRTPFGEAREIGLELEHGSLERLAFAGATLRWRGRALDGITGALSRAPDERGFRLRAARAGLVAVGRIAGDGSAEIEATLEGLPLASLVGDRASRAQASGGVIVRVASGAVWARGRVGLSEVTLDHRALASRPLGPLSVTLDGDARWDGGALSVERLQVTEGPATVTLAGHVSTVDFDVEAELERVECGALLQSLPRDLVPALDGLTLDGELAARARLHGRLDALDKLELALDLDAGCRVQVDPPLADSHTLAIGKGPPLLHAHDDEGRARDIVLGSTNPAFRNLSSLPPQLVKAFLVSEDGSFFHHHGFDLEMIRRALAADLQLQRIDRGASTVSQQTVKNLFLSGERTAARKLEELVLTWRMEQLVGKRRILELYLNLVELGPGVYGISEGAERYFGKEPEELSADEAAQLAALLPAPRRGMDAAWKKRYEALKARIPNEFITIPPPGA